MRSIVHVDKCLVCMTRTNVFNDLTSFIVETHNSFSPNASANAFLSHLVDDVKSWREKEVSNPNTLQKLVLREC